MENESTSSPSLRRDMGGLIQSAKRTLLIILGSQQLKAEVFQTIVAETEGLLNSIPITYVSSDTNNEEALTPNHFLLRRPYSPLAPLTSTSRTFTKKEFSYTQILLNHFWKRLQKESTSDLISRPKWRTESEQLKEGDLVWLLHEFTPRVIWPSEMPQWIGRTSTILRNQDINWSAEQTSSQIS